MSWKQFTTDDEFKRALNRWKKGKDPDVLPAIEYHRMWRGKKAKKT